MKVVEVLKPPAVSNMSLRAREHSTLRNVTKKGRSRHWARGLRRIWALIQEKLSSELDGRLLPRGVEVGD